MEYDVGSTAVMNSSLHYVNIKASLVCIIQNRSFQIYTFFYYNVYMYRYLEVERGIKKCTGMFIYTEISEIEIPRVVILVTNTLHRIKKYPCAI
jgi:hypothetical protein